MRYGDRRMILDLTALEPPPIDPPAGVEIVTWAERLELAPGIYEVACEAFPDIPGAEDELMEAFEDWLAHQMQGSGDLPEATFLALVGAEVVGYSKISLTAAQPTTAHHDMTGVKRAWRGRGIAGALKRAQIAWAKEQGYERLATQNELRNEPIRRLNERLGYTEAPGQIVVSYETYALVREHFLAHPLHPIQIKGISRSVVPYVVDGMLEDTGRETALFSEHAPGLNLYLDPSALNQETLARARSLLQDAVAALDVKLGSDCMS